MNFLRPFLAVWLTLQFLMPLVPTWGVFLPHGHIATGRVTERDWQAHGENHQSQYSQDTSRAETTVLSVASIDGLMSVFGSTDLTKPQPLLWIFNLNDFCGYSVQACFTARAIDLPVIIPPPKPHNGIHTSLSSY